MEKYQYETEKVGFTAEGIHLLRNKFNYQTIHYADVKEIRLDKGRQIKNWLVTLVLGVVLLSLGFFLGFSVIYAYFFDDDVRRFYAEQFAAPVIPLFLGAYALYICFQTGYLLVINADAKSQKIPVGNFDVKYDIDQFKGYLSQYLPAEKLVFRQ